MSFKPLNNNFTGGVSFSSVAKEDYLGCIKSQLRMS